VNMSGDRTDSDSDSDAVPPTKLLPTMKKATGIVLGAADVLGPRGPRTTSAQVGSDASLHVSSLFGGTRIVHAHVQA